jgi:hypothetical protein
LPVVQSVSTEQVVRQALTPHRYGAQLSVPGLEQVPLPEQKAVGVNVPAVQDGLPHWTEVEACWQVPPPLQTPVLPQVVLPAGQPPWGSATPLATLTQIPDVPHTWQVGQLATPQQTPSTQLPVAHWIGSLQAAPEAFLSRHIPFGPVQ